MSARLVAAVLVALATPACAQQVDADAPFAKSAWKVAKVGCPAGCSAATAAVLKGQVGQPVQLSATQLVAPFVDPCEGQVHVSLKTMPVVADVNKGMAPGRKRLAAADLGVGGSALSGWARCQGRAGDTNLQRLLVVAANRVVLLSEEQSLIELR